MILATYFALIKIILKIWASYFLTRSISWSDYPMFLGLIEFMDLRALKGSHDYNKRGLGIYCCTGNV